jgi:hypothetical protein
MKEIIRRILFLVPGNGFRATEGTRWFRFLMWLYGSDSFYADFDCWYPDEEEK